MLDYVSRYSIYIRRMLSAFPSGRVRFLKVHLSKGCCCVDILKSVRSTLEDKANSRPSTEISHPYSLRKNLM